jgi:hypothetical protein
VRTLVELKPQNRSRLIAIAAKRGKKGFPFVLNKAVESYLGAGAKREAQRQRALQLRGSLTHAEADELRKQAAALRVTW